jgi:hypothetical protein
VLLNKFTIYGFIRYNRCSIFIYLVIYTSKYFSFFMKKNENGGSSLDFRWETHAYFHFMPNQRHLQDFPNKGRFPCDFRFGPMVRTTGPSKPPDANANANAQPNRPLLFLEVHRARAPPNPRSLNRVSCCYFWHGCFGLEAPGAAAGHDHAPSPFPG